MHVYLRTSLDLAFSSLAVALFVHYLRWKRSVAELPLPPGPRRLPLVHNLFDLPKGFEAAHWAKHKDRYGPISSVSVFGSTYIIVNDEKIAFELLDRRSAKYSDRPDFVFAEELVGFEGTTPYLQYGPLLKLHRKEMARVIGPAAIGHYIQLEEVETRRFLLRLLEEPDRLIDHIRTLAGAIILKISHGYTINPRGRDPFVDLADRVLNIFSRVSTPGAYLVDIFPILRYLPEWCPGAGFKKEAKAYAKEVKIYNDRPFAFVKHQMNLGVAQPSLASGIIQRDVAIHHDMKWIASTLYGGGSDTTVSAIATFFIAMVLHPEVLERAQEELDRVLGRDRLPCLIDRLQLPYIEALEKESLRWNSVVPMGVPHVLSQDDTYMGFRLPKGAVVLPNIWQMIHDPSIYPDPFEFRPERFLGSSPQPDPRQLVFGFGRRICPGKELADGSLFLSIAMTAATFNIGRARDATGQEILPTNECSPGLISHPMPFKYILTPRDGRAIVLIRTIVDDHPFETSDAAVLEKL